MALLSSNRRILYVSRVSEIGGAERSLLELVARLPRDQFTLEAAVPREAALGRALTACGVTVHYWSKSSQAARHGAPRAVRAAAEGWTAYRAITAIAQRRAIQIIHANTNRAAAVCVPAARRLGVPLLWHVRDYPNLIETILLAGFGAVPIAISPSSAVRVATILRCSPVLIENGIDATRFALRAPPARNAVGALKLVAVAHLAGWKGHELLLEAFARARSQIRRSMVLTLVGGDPFNREHALAGRIRRQVAALGGSVTWLGPSLDVRAQLEDADLLVHPAFPEPFGRAVVEALCMGIPVIAFDGAHGPADTIRRVGGGLLVTERTAAALAEAILHAVKQLDAYDMSARAAAKNARCWYSSQRVGAQVEELYHRVGVPLRR